MGVFPRESASRLPQATDLSDILFGTPMLTFTESNLGVLKKESINIAMNGHNPVLSEIICDVAEEMTDAAKEAGADGINIVGICCTGNELDQHLRLCGCGA